MDFRKIIKEESDDFDWVRDHQLRLAKRYVPNIGDKLICLPGYRGGNNKLPGNADNDDGYGGYGYKEYRVIKVDRYTNEESRTVVWSDGNKDGGVYIDAMTYYYDSINESDDLQWISDINPNGRELVRDRCEDRF